MLTDISRFPRLAALLDEGAFPIDTFRTNYKLAKECLEMDACRFRRPHKIPDISGQETRQTCEGLRGRP
jgi:hypothetical protein